MLLLLMIVRKILILLINTYVGKPMGIGFNNLVVEMNTNLDLIFMKVLYSMKLKIYLQTSFIC
jgi:hypothetical protein